MMKGLHVMTEVTAPETTPAVVAVWVPREQNGVKEYRPGSVGARVWAIADAATQRDGAWCAAATLIAEGTAQGINEGSCRAGYATWRKFNGLAGTRIDNPEKAAKAAKAAEEKAAKEAEKVAAKAAKAEAAAAAKAAKDAEKVAKAEAKAAEKAAAAAAKIAAAEAAAAEAKAAAQAAATPAPEQPE